jgi:hypothetical protein
VSKRVGFWFFTGDWMKDPELRFCSLFARGLLVDLLCLMFESKNQGELSRPDGSMRTDIEIVDSISGGTQQEKLAALKQLVSSGVLKRDEKTGVLYSSRMRALGNLNQTRSKAGRKGGSKTQAKMKQNGKQAENQTGNQKGGVTDTDSDSDSDTDILENIHTPPSLDLLKREEGQSGKPHEVFSEPSEEISKTKIDAFRRWVRFRFAIDGRWMPIERQDVVLMDLMRLYPDDDDWVKSIEFSIRINAKNVIDWRKDFQLKDQDGGSSHGENVWGGDQ